MMTYRRGQHPKSKANLKPVKPGEVKNPAGRPPKELCITSILREKLHEPCDKDPSVTWAEWLARRALELAGENAAYYKELLDRTEGKVVFPITAQEPVDVVFQIGKGYINPEDAELDTTKFLPVETEDKK